MERGYLCEYSNAALTFPEILSRSGSFPQEVKSPGEVVEAMQAEWDTVLKREEPSCSREDPQLGALSRL